MAKSQTKETIRRGAYLRNTKNEVEIDTEIGQRIRRWRESFEKMTQAELAEGAGVSGASISGYERGTIEPPISALRRIATFLGIPFSVLVETDPGEDWPFWENYIRANKTQKLDIGRMVGAFLGPPKRKK